MQNPRLDRQIYVNQVAQEVFSIAEGQSWFNRLEEEQQREVLRDLVYLGLQAGARIEDVPGAIDGASVKPKDNVGQMLLVGSIREKMSKVPRLPSYELSTGFLLLLHLFRIADARRRAKYCVEGCSHWWHRDLSDPNVIEEVRRNPT